MPELAFAQEVLNAARAFLQLDLRTQWSYRTTLSRLYYAAHHLGRLLLRHAGLIPHLWRRDVHRRVINELQRHYVLTGMMSDDALEALEPLLRYRIQADYDITRMIHPTQITAAMNRYATFSNECYRILGVI
ncbi:hypothetical protein FJZ31_01685 [Candidatus Poribacteria bacterium]|nr:hypothetical protein [Candidatus Poribacteria bacterium]